MSYFSVKKMRYQDIEFQKKFAAVFLPQSQSLCFFKSNFNSITRHYVLWLEQNTAKELCKRDLHSIDDHYRFDDNVSLFRVHAAPSCRLNLPYVGYWSGELRFINGRHRARTLIDFGARYVPFDIEEASLKEMAQDGIKLDYFETIQSFSDRLAPTLRYADREFDPVINTYKQAFPKRMSMENVIETARLHLKLLNFDIKNMVQLESTLSVLNRHQELKMYQDQAYIHNEILWYRDALHIALPAFVSLKHQGVVQWPKNAPFPAYIGGPPNGMTPEEAVKDWAQKLPVPVRLGRLSNANTPR